METGLLGYTGLIIICVIFVIAEYLMGKLKDENRLKKWWRKHVVSDWSNHKKNL